MAGYWLKVYTEILDDIKYYRLSDNAKLAMFELMMIAKKTGDDGKLPPIDDICFLTHNNRTGEWWKKAIEELKSIDFIVDENGAEWSRKFQDRQKPATGAERQSEYRKRNQQSEYSGDENVTNALQNVTEKERKKERETERKEREKEVNAPTEDEMKAWEMARGELQRASRAQFQSHIAPLVLIEVKGQKFTVRAVNKYEADLVNSRFSAALKNGIQGYLGKPVEIEVIT